MRSKNIMSLFEHSTRGHEVDETDSGLGSGGSQASSPATSSVSSVDTNTDDLIDFTTRTFPRTAKGRITVSQSLSFDNLFLFLIRQLTSRLTLQDILVQKA